MAAIIPIEGAQRRPGPRPAAEAGAVPPQTATILLFTGVRRERRPSEAPAAETPLAAWPD